MATFSKLFSGIFLTFLPWSSYSLFQMTYSKLEFFFVACEAELLEMLSRVYLTSERDLWGGYKRDRLPPLRLISIWRQLHPGVQTTIPRYQQQVLLYGLLEDEIQEHWNGRASNLVIEVKLEQSSWIRSIYPYIRSNPTRGTTLPQQRTSCSTSYIHTGSEQVESKGKYTRV